MPRKVIVSASIINWISSWFSPKTATAPKASAVYNPDQDYHPLLQDVPRYPPFDHGLPFISVEELIKSQQTLIDKIKDSELPYADEAVRNLANYVHLLPATSNDFFCGAGGLFRLCLEVGFHSFVASQGNIFTSSDPAEKRRTLDAKWQLAAFLSGLCCELSRTIVTSVVTNDHGEQWLPFEPLTTWLVRTKSKRYFLRPPQASAISTAETTHLSGVIGNSIIPQAALQYITTDDRNILMSMLSAITRLSENLNSGHFQRTVRHIRDQVIQRDKLSNPMNFGKPLVGVHVEPYLINGMRQLVKNGTWKINQKLARIHMGPDGVFIFWATGVQEILDLLKEEGAMGIPADARSLGELLMRSKVLLPNPQGELWWYIKTPISPAVYEVVKLASPGIILDDDAIASVEIYPKAISMDKEDADKLKSANQMQLVPVLGAEEDDITLVTPNNLDDHPSPEMPIPSSDVKKTVSSQPPVAKKKAPDYGSALSIAATENTQPRSNTNPRPIETTDVKTAKVPKKPKHAVNQQQLHIDPSDDVGNIKPPEVFVQPSDSKQDKTPIDYISEVLKRSSFIEGMKLIVECHNNAETSPMLWVTEGLAIPMGTIAKNTGDTTITAQLSTAGCLFINPGQKTKTHIIEIGGKQLDCLILKNQYAQNFGFSRNVTETLSEASTVN